jgi:hypothetical protein
LKYEQEETETDALSVRCVLSNKLKRMIIQLLTQLQGAEKIGVAVVQCAEAAYKAAKHAGLKPEQIAALDPGRHQVALGAIQNAITHVETIMGEAADAQEKTPAGAVGTDGTIHEMPASRATALPGTTTALHTS